MVCCGAGITFAGSDFLFCIGFGSEFLAVGFGCLVLTSIGCSMLVGIDGDLKKALSLFPIRSMWPMHFSVG